MINKIDKQQTKRFSRNKQQPSPIPHGTSQYRSELMEVMETLSSYKTNDAGKYYLFWRIKEHLSQYIKQKFDEFPTNKVPTANIQVH